jgi:alkylation response protein AidB-like acyl-CoA dehydrogenase
MDFSVAESTRETCARVRELVERELFPLEATFLAMGWGTVLPAVEAVRRRVQEAGLWAPQLPAELCGMGLSLRDFAHVGRELGRSPLGHYAFNCQAPDAGNLELLHAYGSREQQERYLRPLAGGEVRSCFAMTEPELAGSNPVWMGTTARRDGNEWVLDGHKWFASSADGADFAVVMAVTDPSAPRHRRASMFLVPTATPGFRLVRNVPVMGHTGEGWASHGELRLEDCRVGLDAVLGGVGEGFALAQSRLGPGRIHHCMRWLGICDRAFELLCRHAIARELAPGEPLARQQTVQTWIAESRAEMRAATLLVLDAAWAIDTLGVRGAREQVSLIKPFVARVLGNVLDRAVQAHGALGVSDDTPLAFFWRSERAARIYDGPDEVHHALVAREALRAFGWDPKERAAAGGAESARERVGAR